MTVCHLWPNSFCGNCLLKAILISSFNGLSLKVYLLNSFIKARKGLVWGQSGEGAGKPTNSSLKKYIYNDAASGGLVENYKLGHTHASHLSYLTQALFI